MNKAQKLFKVGLIGTGRISDIYLQNCLKFDGISVDVCGSLNLQESEEKAQKFGVPRVAHPDAIISDPGIDCILNLTIPATHADISLRSLNAGKHVYSEKPFATNQEDALKILKLAKEKKLKVGNAPDTFCLLYTSPSPRDMRRSRMPSSA